ncbi:hypothetical protein GCM10025868_19510 [Angustibacter aerolatus]|uniref:PBP domain-containing protein n=1 Tax=Angustibacter aerolatus TaxID=1162965 RepID=A0ABQ6JGN5_9ACTN|nr:hypothetical protein GCM10025868_19510 [Angustibacter aerolatus]
MNQWIADVTPSGLKVTFTANGSATGRKNFAFKTTDFALSDIGFQGSDSVTGEADTSNGRAFAYLPIVAGGTSFPYQIRVGTKKVRDLRLSSSTLAKIFTNQITNWNDPAVTKDNNGRQPAEPAHHPGRALGGLGVDRAVHPLPRHRRARHLAAVPRPLGPDGVLPAQGPGGGAERVRRRHQLHQLGRGERCHRIRRVLVRAGQEHAGGQARNAAGYFTLPTQYNVAVALTQAQINTDKSSPNYLLQNLDRVYTYRDVRTYALSSYSYMIIPTAANDQTMTTGKRQTLADYLKYSICEGQREMGPIGYSPLPINLVQAAFDQTAKAKQADPDVDVASSTVSSLPQPDVRAGAAQAQLPRGDRSQAAGLRRGRRRAVQRQHRRRHRQPGRRQGTHQRRVRARGRWWDDGWRCRRRRLGRLGRLRRLRSGWRRDGRRRRTRRHGRGWCRRGRRRCRRGDGRPRDGAGRGRRGGAGRRRRHRPRAVRRAGRGDQARRRCRRAPWGRWRC